MAGFQTPTVKAVINATGTATGYVFVPDNSLFIVNAEAWLNHGGVITDVIITDLVGTNQIGCKIKPGSINPPPGDSGAGPFAGPNYGKSSMTTFVAGDTITMPAQFVGDATAPVAPNVVLLLDQTSGVNSLNDSLALDVSQYSSLSILVIPSGGTETAFNFYLVDDQGANQQCGTVATPTALTLKAWGLGAANGVNGPLPRRVRLTAGAIVAQTTRLLVYGRK